MITRTVLLISAIAMLPVSAYAQVGWPYNYGQTNQSQYGVQPYTQPYYGRPQQQPFYSTVPFQQPQLMQPRCYNLTDIYGKTHVTCQ